VQLFPQKAQLALVLRTHPQTFGAPPPPQVCPASAHVAGPHVSVGHPFPGLNVPQLVPAAHAVGQVLTHCPEALQTSLAPQAGHVMVPPHPLGAVPQACPAGHVVAGVHPQTFGVPAPPQV
jgi:hypothetical protein